MICKLYEKFFKETMATTPNIQYKYYSNPTFCQQSEFYNVQRCKSPNGNSSNVNSSIVNSSNVKDIRQSPLGAQAVRKNSESDSSNSYEEQEFYEEMLVDDRGLVQEKKIVILSSPKRYMTIPQNEDEIKPETYKEKGKYLSGTEETTTKNRYEYIPLQQSEKIDARRVHRYSTIPGDEDTETCITINGGRYALVPIDNVPPNKNRYIVPNKPNQDLNKEKDTQNISYACSQQIEKPVQFQESQTHTTYTQQNVIMSPQAQRRGNPVATQRLYELLQTPKKSRATNGQAPVKNCQLVYNTHGTYSPQKSYTPQKTSTPQKIPSSYKNEPIIYKTESIPYKYESPYKHEPILYKAESTPYGNKSMASPPKQNAPRAQQKLNYNIGSPKSKTTAVISPIYSTTTQSVYSDTTFSNKTESWMQLSVSKKPVQATLAVAAIMMFLCGSLTTGLCFYMISIMGRMYFLDFGIISGFTCLLLGMLGFRTRNCYWLPNRNYISGMYS